MGLHGSNVDILFLLQISFLSLSEFEQRTINHQPSEIKVAPDYYPVCQLKRENKRITKSLSGYDMAIITLTNSVNLETGIKVVSLATESDIPIPESIVYMVGYGQDVKDSDPAGRNGGILKKGELPVIDPFNSLCSDGFIKRFYTTVFLFSTLVYSHRFLLAS